MTGWFASPQSEDDDSYIRYSVELVSKGLRRFTLGGGALPPIRIENAGGVVATLPLADGPFDTTTLPDGHYVAQATNCFPMDFIIRNGTAPVRGPLIPLVQANMVNEKDAGIVGVAWVPYSDPPPLPKGNRLAPRVQAPLDKLPTNANPRDKFWMRPLTRSVGTWSTVREWKEDEQGNVHIGYQQLYARFAVQGLNIGNLRDGPYGLGGVGSPVCLREMADGSVLVTAINAGVKRIHPNGVVETLWGYRLRPTMPIPTTTYGTVLTSAQETAQRDKHYEMVGDVVPMNPWCAIQDEREPGRVIWIANTDAHHVIKYDIVAKKALAIIGSSDGAMGRADGVIGNQPALMRRPRGLAFGPDGLLYVTEAWNHCIGTIDPVTLQYTMRLRSVNNWDTYPGGNTKGTNFYGQNDVQLRPFWNKDGGQGVASFHHPQQCDFTSDGKLIFASDHTRTAFEYDPVANTVRRLFDLMPGDFGQQPAYRHTAWISLAVNRNGVGPIKDHIAVADWDQSSLSIFTRAGVLDCWPLRDAVDHGTVFGRNNRCWMPGYPWAVGWGKDRFLWGDAGSERVQEMSVRLPTDIDYPASKTKAGSDAWVFPPPGGGLSMGARYNGIGFGQLGDEQFQDLATWTDPQIDAWLTSKRPDWGPVTLANVRTYIRYSQQEPEVVVVPPPPPPPAPPVLTIEQRVTTLEAQVAVLIMVRP